MTPAPTDANPVRIEVRGISKRFGDVTAVDDITFNAEPGRVTGFLGPNGAGKSTTLRILLGLSRPDSGAALLGGVRYRDLRMPARTVGAVLDIAGAHPAMTARAHLGVSAALAGIDDHRVDEVAAITGITGFLDRRIRGFSTGMQQRLAIANALLGDPRVLVLDEPSNGLDPAGIAWLRSFLRSFASGGGTVLLSSHVLSELEQCIDDLALIDGGRLVWAGPLAGFVAENGTLEGAFLHATRHSEPHTPALERTS
ncbi:ABC transporter ATP-binding protein [Microbacterium aurantiacum]|uniref:ABC transporter ATP-binding protein n=1 Tax=Microbacterium aurantiacum TaxID=162393 RepID=UPI000C80BC2B|nr:ATP-binding cassette domain-containing protein [Microbacterium aurantiacum]